MTRTADGPTVTRRPIKEAAMFTQQHGVQPDDQRAAFGYVSSEGLLRLSDKTRQQLGVEHGGGVVVVKRDEHPYVEVLTNEQFHQLMVGEEKGNDRRRGARVPAPTGRRPRVRHQHDLQEQP
jgi:hypothetical protein